MAFLWFVLGVMNLLVAVAPAQGSWYYGVPGIVLYNISLAVAPVGLSYAVLSRRILDIGFVINRAAVYTGASAIVLGAFVLMEWILGDWLQRANHTTNVLVGAALALMLGFSVRFVHARVDHVIDRVFFRKRHECEQALRDFAREAAYITESTTLINRTIAILEERARAAFADILLDDRSGRYGSNAENDPAIVRLRATPKVLELHGLDSALQGDLAFPMVARGRLVAVLIVGPQKSGDSYAPDEISAIAQVAQSVGNALDVLASEQGAQSELLVAIRALHQAILERLPERRMT